MSQAVSVLVAVAAALTALALRHGRQKAVQGYLGGARALRAQLPLLLAAFALAGYVEVLLPADLVQAWLGAGAGLRGIVIGGLAGAILPFGPYIVFPMAAAVRATGAGDATLVAFTAGWMLLSTGRIAYEMATFGPGFTWRRLALFAPAALAAGGLALLLTR